MYNLSIMNNKQLPFLQYIALGIKKAECRIASKYVRSFKGGEELLLSSSTEFALCRIIYLHFYNDFDSMIECEGLKNIVPFVDSKQEALEIYNSFPRAERVKSLGCCAIGVECIESKLSFNL